MKRILTAEQMKRCDDYTISSGTPSRALMQRAAEAVFSRITSGDFDLSHVLCLCGVGNNGGDGLALASLLQSNGIDTAYLLCGDKNRMTSECSYRLKEAKKAGIRRITGTDLSEFTLICDALFGVGFRGSARGDAARVIDAAKKSGITSVALDIPSGVNADSVNQSTEYIPANLTLALAYLKPGHIMYPGRSACGKIEVCDIGINDDAAGGKYSLYMPEDSDIPKMLPRRTPYSHKGTYGRLLCVAGSEGMCGAAYLSALGAYRSGAGIVEVFTKSSNIPIIQGLLPEAVAAGWDDGDTSLLREKLRSADVCVIGPGLGRSPAAAKLVSEAMCSDLPLLCDADALNIISADPVLGEMLTERKYPTVITPHPGEAARLIGSTTADICADPIGYAEKISEKFRSVCVLKGSVSVTADAVSGKVYLNPTGCSGLAKGGSGDVLSGVIGAFMAAGTRNPLIAAAAGVFIHGRAGEIASSVKSEYSLLASDIADNIGAALLSITPEHSTPHSTQKLL